MIDQPTVVSEAGKNFYVDDQTECPACKEDRETSCRCGWYPGLCKSCVEAEDTGDGYCGTCFPSDGSGNQGTP